VHTRKVLKHALEDEGEVPRRERSERRAEQPLPLAVIKTVHSVREPANELMKASRIPQSRPSSCSTGETMPCCEEAMTS